MKHFGNLLNIASFLGIVPFTWKSKSIFRYYPIVMTLLHNVLCLAIILQANSSIISIFIADVALNLTHSLIVIVYGYKAYKSDHWIVFLKLIKKVDDKLKGNRRLFALTKTHIGLIVAFLIVTITIDCFLWFKLGNHPIIETSTQVICRFIYIHKIILASLIETSVKILNYHYVLFGNKLRCLSCYSKNEKYALKEIRRARNFYIYLYKSVHSFNSIFSPINFLMLQIMIVRYLLTLYIINSHLEVSEYLLDVELFLYNIYGLTMDLILTLMIVMSSDAIEVHSQTLDEICHELILNKFSNSSLRKELLDLSQSFKILAPQISAAGFFTLNRRVLLGLASVITTYFIVYLQFK